MRCCAPHVNKQAPERHCRDALTSPWCALWHRTEDTHDDHTGARQGAKNVRGFDQASIRTLIHTRRIRYMAEAEQSGSFFEPAHVYVGKPQKAVLDKHSSSRLPWACVELSSVLHACGRRTPARPSHSATLASVAAATSLEMWERGGCRLKFALIPNLSRFWVPSFFIVII